MPMNATPRAVRPMPPSPPASRLPPMMTAMMASSSMFVPAAAAADLDRTAGVRADGETACPDVGAERDEDSVEPEAADEQSLHEPGAERCSETRQQRERDAPGRGEDEPDHGAREADHRAGRKV